MDQYQDWQDEDDDNIPIKCPVHNYIVSPMNNQSNYRHKEIIQTNYIHPNERIYSSPNYFIHGNDEFDNYNNNSGQNNYQFNNPNKRQFDYSNQYYHEINFNDNYNRTNQYIRNINNNPDITSSLTKYESSDGVLRGYTNNYSFYVSGTSQVKPKVTINNQYNNQNFNNNNININYQNRNPNLKKRQLMYKNATSPIKRGQYQRIIYQNNNNNSNINNREINRNETSSYMIRMVENEPVIYNQPNQHYTNNNNYNINYNNYNSYNNEDDIYYFNENNNNDRVQQRYEGPKVQRRIVKRVVEKEPRGDYYIIDPNDNLRNVKKNIIQQKPNYKKISANNINERIINLNQNENFSSYTQRRNNTPLNINPNRTTNNVNNRPLINRQRRIIVHTPNYYPSKNSYNSVSYPNKRFAQQDDYMFIRNDRNSPRKRITYLNKSPNIEYINDKYNRYIYPMEPREREREYTSRTEIQNEREFEYEYEDNDEDDDVYEVPEQYNHINIRRNFYEERRPITPDRPFTKLSNDSPSERNRKKYGVYTQTLTMNRNYDYNDDEEYEVTDIRNRRNRRYRRNNNRKDNYSVPKVMRPINDVRRLVRQNREYRNFERNLRNIRDNEEEIDFDTEDRNSGVKIKTSGSNNQGLYISNNRRDGSPRNYKTYTELQSNRSSKYIFQELDDDNLDEYDSYKNERNIDKNNNIRIIQREKLNEKRDRPPSPPYQREERNYYKEENLENMNNQNNEEIEDEDNNDDEEQMYDTNQLMTAKEENFKIINNNNNKIKINKRSNEEYLETNNIIKQNSEDQDQMNENDIEGEEHEHEEEGIIQQTSTNINNNEEILYQREDSPQDIYESQKGNKNVKNIQTEINEKYYDNQGNYLGEKKIITTKQVPINNQQEEGEYLEEQEEQEQEQEQEENENENENGNENENVNGNVNGNKYTPYESNHKKFKKRGDKKKNIIESKYHSYFGDSNNNVYYEIKGVSGDANKEEESKNDEDVQNRNYKGPMVEVKNINFGIQSENLCMPAKDNNDNDNDNGEKDNNDIDEKNNTDDKEADEQQIDENAIIDEEEEEEEQNNINENNNNIQNIQDLENNENNKNNINNENNENKDNNNNLNYQEQQNINYNDTENENNNNIQENEINQNNEL